VDKTPSFQRFVYVLKSGKVAELVFDGNGNQLIFGMGSWYNRIVLMD